jgi:multidrug efflux pump
VISRFFIDRPIFAAVLSILTVLAGGVSYLTLPLSQFPNITPPTVSVTCNYPGASAQDVADAVAAPIEQQVNGVEGMMYMSSQCANDGSYNLTVTFQQGVDINMAQVLVQNRVNLAVPLLPEVIRQTGVITRKRSPDILMGMAIYSKSGRYDQLYLSNFALMQIKDEMARVKGVGDVFLFGQRDYSMRVWVDPGKLAARRMTAGDVVRAIREQNSQVAAGHVGQQPSRGDQETQITLTTLGRLDDPALFSEIILKTDSRGRVTRLKDVARVELGSKNEDVSVRFDGQDTVFLAIFQMPDANALDVRGRVMEKLAELKESFPEGVDYDVGFDTTPYTRESIWEVFKTLVEALILVAVVVLVFLRNWRSALIPLVAVPVAIVGTFAAMAALGFSLNNLTLFGLVLAIGIVVDDAIVVVEAVEHHIDLGLSPREATIKAMHQVSGPVIAVGLVLSAVFVPCAFISGITGQFFRQFAVTIAVSTVISAFNSLTLSPALTALLLKPRNKSEAPPLPWVIFPLAGGVAALLFLTSRLRTPLEQLGSRLPENMTQTWTASLTWSVPVLAAVCGVAAGAILGDPINRFLGWLFRGFHTGFGLATGMYARTVGGLLRVSVIVLVVYGGLLVLTYGLFKTTPRGFIPSQDMGYLMLNVQLPDSASKERADAVMANIEKIAKNAEDDSHDSRRGILHVSGISGQSFVLSANGSNFGSLFVNLKPYSERRDPSLSSEAIANKLRTELAKIPEATIAVFPPPPVRGVGRAGGFALMLEDRGAEGPQVLQEQMESLLRAGNATDEAGKPLHGVTNLFSVFRANVPQIHIKPDKRACMAKGVNVRDFADTLEVYEGSLYVNDFNLFDRTWQVIVQAESASRDQIEDLTQLKVRNNRGGMVPLGAVARIQEVNGPLVLNRYNMYPAAAVNGSAAPGMSSHQVIDIMNELVEREVSPSMKHEWTDMSYLELLAGSTAMLIFACSIVAVFLVLAALYESLSLPLAVILVVPMCLLSAIAGVKIAHMDINIFTQIGFVVLVGLASKNAILIVEFAKKQREAGASRREATLEACKLRLRPIVMTSFAFILGVVPLILAQGAGAEMRQTLGTAVFAGMLGVTLFGVFLTPVFYFTIDWLGKTQVAQSVGAQVLTHILLDGLTLGIPRMARMLSSRSTTIRPAVARKAGVNGQTPVLSTQYSVFSKPESKAVPPATKT